MQYIFITKIMREHRSTMYLLPLLKGRPRSPFGLKLCSWSPFESKVSSQKLLDTKISYSCLMLIKFMWHRTKITILKDKHTYLPYDFQTVLEVYHNIYEKISLFSQQYNIFDAMEWHLQQLQYLWCDGMALFNNYNIFDAMELHYSTTTISLMRWNGTIQQLQHLWCDGMALFNNYKGHFGRKKMMVVILV